MSTCLAVAACAEPPPESQAAASTFQRTQETVKTIDEATLRETVEADGVVALVRPTEASIARAGTRSEMLTVTATTVQRIHGDPGDTVEIRRHTSGGDTVLETDRLYVVALQPVPRFAPGLFMAGHVPVRAGKEDASVEAHRRILDRLGS